MFDEEKRPVFVGFWCGYLKDREHSEGIDVDGR
jgi:hypothetical protein